MFGRLIWTLLLAAAGYIAWRFLRNDHQPPVMYQPAEPVVRTAPLMQAAAPPADAPQASASTESAPSMISIEPEAPSAAQEDAGISTTPAAAQAESNGAQPAEGVEIDAYCMRCRTRRIIGGARPEVTANGRHGMRGTCTTCGTNVFTFVKEK